MQHENIDYSPDVSRYGNSLVGLNLGMLLRCEVLISEVRHAAIATRTTLSSIYQGMSVWLVESIGLLG